MSAELNSQKTYTYIFSLCPFCHKTNEANEREVKYRVHTLSQNILNIIVIYSHFLHENCLISKDTSYSSSTKDCKSICPICLEFNSDITNFKEDILLWKKH